MRFSGQEARFGHLDDCVKVCELAEVSVGHLPGPRVLRGLQQLQALQLSQDLPLNLRMLRDQVPAAPLTPSFIKSSVRLAQISSEQHCCTWSHLLSRQQLSDQRVMSMHHDNSQQETGIFALLSSQGSVLQQALACMHIHVYE